MQTLISEVKVLPRYWRGTC